MKFLKVLGQIAVLLFVVPVMIAAVFVLVPLVILIAVPIVLRRLIVNWSKGSFYHALRAWLRFGRSPKRLAQLLGVSLEELNSAQPSYRTAKIPKRNGRLRELHIPDDATRRLQRRLLRRVLGKLRAHPAAVGFERGKSIVDNGRPHVGQAVVVKLDVIDFFPNTSAERVEAYFRRIGWNRAAAEILTQLTTWEGGLPQGAPTSPRLSNLVNRPIDIRLAQVAARRKSEYTRYADDITFSFPKDYPKRVRGAVQATRAILRAYGYELHGRKTRILRRHQRQAVTGLVVNDTVGLPRELRRKLRAARHRLCIGQEATWTEAQLHGWTAFERMVAEQRQKKGE